MSDYWRLRGLLGLTLLVLPWVLLVTILRPSLSLLGWLTSCLWLALLLGLAMQSFTGRTNLPLARRLPPLSLVALAALCLQLLVFPAEVRFWLPEEWYAPVQLVAALGGVAVVVGLVRLVRTTVVPPTSPRSLAEALAELGRLPDGGRGRYGRRLRRWLAEQVGRQTLVDRLRSAVVHRTAALGRYLAVAVVVAVAAVVQLVLTRGAFVEGWVALLVGLALAAETRVYLWRREGVLDGFVEPDPWAGRTLYDAWWGASAGMAPPPDAWRQRASARIRSLWAAASAALRSVRFWVASEVPASPVLTRPSFWANSTSWRSESSSLDLVCCSWSSR